MLTNSSAKTTKDGLYPHHRGLFFGFNKISYGDKQTADIWHGTDNVFSQPDKIARAAEAGEVMGRIAPRSPGTARTARRSRPRSAKSRLTPRPAER